jgi:hypothetical protein
MDQTIHFENKQVEVPPSQVSNLGAIRGSELSGRGRTFKHQSPFFERETGLMPPII